MAEVVPPKLLGKARPPPDSMDIFDNDRMEVIGRYALGAQVGVGGMASVYVGWLTGAADFSRVVAIKRMHPEFVFDEERAVRFRDEARLSSRLLHPNIVQVLDVVESKGELLIVMEYVHGVSLRTLSEDTKAAGCRLPTGVVAGILVPALHGLHAAHEANDQEGQPLGIVHRDFSPSNIMVSSDGHAKILDFGVAKARTHAHITSVGLISGKLGYFAPEQVEGASLDRRTDVFAAGTVLWEMLTGERLFGDPGLREPTSFHRLLRAPIRPPSTLNHDLPTRLDEIVLCALERSPDQRYASARAMALDLEAAIEVASASTVSGWVECLCSKRLAALSRALAGIQGQAPPPDLDVSAVAAPKFDETSPSTLNGEGTAARTLAERPSARPASVQPRRLAIGAMLAATALFLGLHSHPVAPSRTAAKEADASLISTVHAAFQSVPAAHASAPALRQTPDIVPAPAEPAHPAANLPHKASRVRPGKARSASSVPSRKRPATKKTDLATPPNCDPPTYLDPDGIRVFKEECL